MSEERVKEQDTGVSCLVLVTIFKSGLFIAKNSKNKPCTGDKLIEAKVVAQLPSFISSDIRPILEYEILREVIRKRLQRHMRKYWKISRRKDFQRKM